MMPVAQTRPRLGVDMDNTIVCYDGLFHRLALDKGLIPADLPIDKNSVRNHLRAIGREEEWTLMQGQGYGPGIVGASAYPGVLDFFRDCRKTGVDVFIVSHKTRHPYLGPQYDLHDAARLWLRTSGITDPANIGLPDDAVFLETSKQDKIQRIARLGCTHFIDDLPELLSDPSFPTSIRTILFDPQQLHGPDNRLSRLHHWRDIWSVIGHQPGGETGHG